MKHIKIFENNINEADDKKISQIISILNNILKPGKDKGSSLAMIDTRDFKLAAEEIIKTFKL